MLSTPLSVSDSQSSLNSGECAVKDEAPWLRSIPGRSRDMRVAARPPGPRPVSKRESLSLGQGGGT